MRPPRPLAGSSLVLFLAMAGAALAADGSPPSPDLAVAVNGVTEKEELLLFFEEKDLYTATKRATSLRKAPAIATIITAEEIRNMGARTLLDVLKLVPGLGVSVNELGLHMIEVRGIRSFVSEKLLVMIDGHSLNRNITGSAFYSYAEALPLENVRQVEVVRGPGSALHGNSAFVATINIITRDAEEIDGLDVKAGTGSFETTQGNVTGGGSIGDSLAVSGSLDHQRSDGPEQTVEADTLTGTGYSSAPGTPSLRMKQTDGFLKLRYRDLSFRGEYRTIRKDIFLGFGPALADDSYGKYEMSWGELAYTFRPTGSLNANTKIFLDSWEQDPNVKIYPDGFLGLFPNGVIGKPHAKDRTIGGEVQLDIDVFRGNHLISGVSYEQLRQYDVWQRANFDPLTGAPLASVQEVANWNKDATRDVFAVYLQDEWELPARVNLTAGVRYDRYSDFGDTTNPRVGLVWGFLDGADLKLLYGKAFRAPNFQELYNVNNPAQLGNPDLDPERITTWEAALGWRANRSFAANVAFFRSTIEDQIDVDPTASPVPTYANLGRSETQGIEAGLDGGVGKELAWRATYAWQNPRDADSGDRLPYVPSQRASGRVNYSPVKYLNLHTDVLWTGRRPRGEGDSRPDMPSYATVDLAVTLKNFWQSLELQATVRNLFDKRYKDPDTSGGNVNLSGTGPKVPDDFPREGISWFLTASYGL